MIDPKRVLDVLSKKVEPTSEDLEELLNLAVQCPRPINLIIAKDTTNLVLELKDKDEREAFMGSEATIEAFNKLGEDLGWFCGVDKEEAE